MTPEKSMDPNLCPICHEPNVCAMEIAEATGTAPARCWCMGVAFTPEVMKSVPDEAKGKVCICFKCSNTSKKPVSFNTH